MQHNANAKSLPESRVLIAGGTSGVGLASAIAFANAGTRQIAIMGRNPERGAAARKLVIEQSPKEARIELVTADATNVGEAQAAVEKTAELFGGIDVLVNSVHGPNNARLLHEVPADQIGRILHECLLGHFHMTRLVLPYMQSQKGGAIINVASDSAKYPTPGGTILGASMAAIAMLSRTLAMEAKRHNIRVNAITPALIEGTPLFDSVMSDEYSARLFKEVTRKSALGIATADDCAALIVFLASPGAGRLTAQVISINGGMSAA